MGNEREAEMKMEIDEEKRVDQVVEREEQGEEQMREESQTSDYTSEMEYNEKESAIIEYERVHLTNII